jgi:thiamine pyrophosphate-dependent acetolactate synthase large subunit-like protein
LFADLGNSFAWAFRHARLRAEQELFVPAGLASMGSGLGAALGAATLWQNRVVACVTGDCAALMCGNELKTAVEYDIPLKIFVMNDRGHGMVDHGSRLVGLHATRVRFRHRVDFQAYAESLGVRAQCISSTGEWGGLALTRLLEAPGPALIDTWIDEAVVPPIADRAKVVDAAAHRIADAG